MNSENQEIANCIKTLESGGVIIFPTDTILGIGCDASDTKAVKRIIELKDRLDHKGFIVLIHSINDLAKYVARIPDSIDELLSNYKQPTSVIYPKGKNLSELVMGKNGSVAIRIVKSGFAYELLNTFGKAIVATSVNPSRQTPAQNINQVNEAILKGVDYVVNLPLSKEARKASTIIKINSEGQKQIIRE